MIKLAKHFSNWLVFNLIKTKNNLEVRRQRQQFAVILIRLPIWFCWPRVWSEFSSLWFPVSNFLFESQTGSKLIAFHLGKKSQSSQAIKWIRNFAHLHQQKLEVDPTESNSAVSFEANSISSRVATSDYRAFSRWSSDSGFEWTNCVCFHLRGFSAMKRQAAAVAVAISDDSADLESKSFHRSMTHRSKTHPSTWYHPEMKADGLVLEICSNELESDRKIWELRRQVIGRHDEDSRKKRLARRLFASNWIPFVASIEEISRQSWRYT